MAGGRSLWDQLIAGTGDAIADIRQKLVEEPWYGRTLDVPLGDLAPRSQTEQSPGDERALSHAPTDITPPGHDDGIER